MNTPTRWLVPLLVAALAAGSCVAPMSPGWETSGARGLQSGGGSQSSPYGAPGVANASAGGGTFQGDGQFPLYGRDGGVVDSRGPGSVTTDTPSRDVEPAGSGRMYILELYQAAIDDRDALQLEVAALNRALERTHADLDATTTALTARGDELARATRERDRLRAENADLTARLVTAQIRRLESDKLLIESKLEWYRGMPLQPSTPKASPGTPTEGASEAKDSSNETPMAAAAEKTEG